MTLGKALRLRRIFGRGRAVVVDTAALEPDPVTYVRRLAHKGADAVVLSPGLLETVAEELGELAVILSSPVEEILQMGADAVIAELDELGDVAEAARRWGVPLFARMPAGAYTAYPLWSASHQGADVICLPGLAIAKQIQEVRAVRRTFLAEVASPINVVDQTYGFMQGPAQGVLLRHSALLESGPLEALNALVHQGVSAPEASAILDRGRLAGHGNRT
jgi:hypothetical protein